MLGLLRRAPAHPGRARKRVVLRLEGYEQRDQPSDLTGGGGPPISTNGDSTNQAPVITLQCSEVATGWILVTGTVTDDQPVGGLTVRLGGVPSAQGVTIPVQMNGTFSYMLKVKTDGSDIGDVTAQTTDALGANSNVAWKSIHPNP
jgi:hypothetical protein